MGNLFEKAPKTAEGCSVSANPSSGAMQLAINTIKEVYAPPEIRRELKHAIESCDVELIRSISARGNLSPFELFFEAIRKDNVQVLSVFDHEGQSLLEHCARNLDTLRPDILQHRISVCSSTGCVYVHPIHVAAWEGTPQILEGLLRSGASPNHPDQTFGGSPLHTCVKSNRDEQKTLECLKLLLKFGGNVDAKDFDSETPIVHATRLRKINHVKMLMQNRAHLDVKCKDGNAVMEMISKNIPCALDDFTDRLNEGVNSSQAKHGIVKLDFRKVFTTTWNTRRGPGDMAFFFGLINSHFKTTLEHPLLWAFLNMKLVQVKKFYYFTIMCHLVFSLLISLYCGAVFNRICPAEGQTNVEERWDVFSTIHCNLKKRASDRWKMVVIISWILLLFSLIIYTMKELVKMTTRPRSYFYYSKGDVYRNMDSYRNVAIIILSMLAVSQGKMMFGCEVYEVPRWTYYSASCACFTTWWEMMFMVGKIPKFGKYVHMFRSVLLEMTRFMVAYIFLIIGFMMSFIIYFADQDPFQSFPGFFVKILVMMTGEIEYDNLKYSQQLHIVNESLSNGTVTERIEERRILNHFPYLAHPLVLTFVIMVNIVMMSLLVALAIRDIEALSKRAQRRELEDQILLINHVEISFSSKLFRGCPDFVKSFLEKWVLSGTGSFDMNPEINFLERRDNSVHSNLFKACLKNFCHNENARLKQMESTIDMRNELMCVKMELQNLMEKIQTLQSGNQN